ncbi:MAG TPA: beta-propeller fold lactonase family protein [Candidatus Angelobacter sp.]|nr:beta-propeller fold lactonase family protein [Candidatus Angelobacter sp.]
MSTSTTSQASAAGFVFVTNSGSGTVSAFAMSSTGSLSPAGMPFPAGAGAEFMAFDPVHKLLFVSNQQANTVSAFSINTSTGALAVVAGSPFVTGARPTGIAVDAMGRFVFVANQAANTISAFSIGANGLLSPVLGSPFTTGNPFGLAVSPAGTLLFANNFPDSMVSDLNTVSAFQIGANGALSAVPGSPFATANSAGFASAIGLTIDPTGKFLFVADHMAQTIVPFSIASTGALTSVAALPAPAPSCSVSCHNNPLRLTVHPNDRFVYATNVQAGTVTAFSIANGALSPIGDVATGAHPFGVALDPSGQFLFVVNKVDNSISASTVNSSTGMVTPISGSPFSGTLNAPTDIVVIAKQ